MTDYNTNLIVNAGAENGTGSADDTVVPIPSWTTTGNFTAAQYVGNPPKPDDGGTNYFYGGPSNSASSASQDIAIGDLGDQIDAGNVTATLSAELGGFGAQDDHITLSVTWLDANGNSVGTTLTDPTVLAADRGNESGFRTVTISGVVPAGAVTARVEMDAVRAAGTDDDGYADNLSLVLTNTAVCFVSGTRIRTTRGERAVETLVVGDLAVCASGATRPIRWLGHRTIDCSAAFHARPVRVAAGAFGGGLPTRDLHLSPGHPVLVGADADDDGGHLVPIMCLINGTTIAHERVDAVTYWHVELDAHDILLAEGLPAESYLDWGDRAFFGEGALHALANPDFVVAGLAARCRPVAIDGPVVEAERRRLDRVFAARLAAASAWPDEVGLRF